MSNGISPALQIVLAEDNPSDVMLVRMALKESGIDYVLRVLEDGEQAISFVQNCQTIPVPMDLVLLDLHLPKCDGADILKMLRAVEHYAHTPVILMSGADAPRDSETEWTQPDVHFFRKPSGLTEFMAFGAVVRDILCAKKKADQVRLGDSARRGGAA